MSDITWRQRQEILLQVAVFLPVEHSFGQSSDDDDEHDDDADCDCGGAGDDDDDDASRAFLHSELGQKYCSDTKNYQRAEPRHPKSSKRTI